MIETMGTPGVRRPVTMVLVTDQFHCRRLIMAGRQLADREGASLEVVNVAEAPCSGGFGCALRRWIFMWWSTGETFAW